jgi:hypothetical protein
MQAVCYLILNVTFKHGLTMVKRQAAIVKRANNCSWRVHSVDGSTPSSSEDGGSGDGGPARTGQQTLDRTD